jgi:hypothetical protein
MPPLKMPREPARPDRLGDGHDPQTGVEEDDVDREAHSEGVHAPQRVG